MLALPLLASALAVPLAFLLRARRDFGAATCLIAPARRKAEWVPRSPWRGGCSGGVLAAWLLGGLVMGLVLGSIAHSVTGMLDSPEMRRYVELLGGAQGLTDAFLAAEVGILGAVVSAFGIATVLRMSGEETAGRAEQILATAVSRLRWAAGYLLVAVLGVAAILLLTGAAMGLAHGLAIDDPVGQVGRLTAAAAGQIPAALVRRP